MYLSRSGDLISILTFLLSLGLFALGGWLLTVHTARQPRRDRAPIGIALGLSLSIPLTALLAKNLPLEPAWWVAATLTLAAGILAAWRNRPKRWIDLRDLLAAMPSLLAILALTLLFALINRGLAIFDDYHNLPLISTMAAGDVPPHFYLNSALNLHYHFGLQLIAAAMVRIGGFFPWSAYDLTNALFLSLTLVLTCHWIRRASGSALVGLLGGAALAFVGGARWLLLFLPTDVLSQLSEQIQLQGSALATGTTFAQTLSSPWNIEGGGPVAFPFAHAPGVLAPLVQSMTGSGAFPVLIPVLLLLLVRRRPSWRELGLYTLVLAALALTAETVFVTVMLGGFAAALVLAFHQKKLESRWWVLMIGASALALLQGGVLTELAQQFMSSLVGTTTPSTGFHGFALHWPPAVLSVHFGRLSLFDPIQWPVALAELGPAVLLGFPITRCSWRRLRDGDWLIGALGLGAVIAFSLPLVLHYQVERDTTRITATALTIWLLLGIPWLSKSWKTLRNWKKVSFILTLAAGGLSGMELFAVELQAIPVPQQSYFVNGMDARMSGSHWDTLPPQAEVFDPLPFRSVTLFGRPATTHAALRQPLPEFDDLLDDFTPARAAAYGFDYLYAEGMWFWRLDPEEREAFDQACVVLLDEQVDDLGDFRRLYDVHACSP